MSNANTLSGTDQGRQYIITGLSSQFARAAFDLYDETFPGSILNIERTSPNAVKRKTSLAEETLSELDFDERKTAVTLAANAVLISRKHRIPINNILVTDHFSQDQAAVYDAAREIAHQNMTAKPTWATKLRSINLLQLPELKLGVAFRRQTG